uniref:Glucokinase n=1 Tax=Candidatus Kentrum sp. FM TaxID=2126340 RepID=A0A450TCY6_9GAMM|nr:MAG: hypothetical protein BECKFM1743C_GA0114222_103282 [Candidatus Kentron sp. FM]VFJ64714.1 MAG: hypothetical protein BECKFM1743A_GA0114220_103631 [Candidatus Kentron sp. FM]VFK15265.1 MAG: hypothetical protein BECKFM1743B_GA0114221_103632 [Candidatus Kentron sp. FM]
MQAILFDLGGTHLRTGLLITDDEIHVLQKEGMEPFPDKKDPSRVWGRIEDRLVQHIQRNAATLSPEAPIVLAFPGPVVADNHILQAPTINGCIPKK